MGFEKHFEKYKPRLKDYLRQKGVDVSINPIHCFNQSAHKNGDANPSCQLWDESFKCYACGASGDIYDAIEILEGVTEKSGQYEFAEKFFGGAPVTPSTYSPAKDEKEFTPDGSSMSRFEEYLRQNTAAESQIKKFLCERAQASVEGAQAYPPGIEEFIVSRFFYWPGLDDVRKYLGNDLLKKIGIPLVNPNTGRSTWEHSGIVMKLGTGYKLHYYQNNYCNSCKEKETCPKYKRGGLCKTCEKRTSKGGKTFPMPGAVDVTLPVILVEGEMNALSCAAMGIKNIFSAGGTNGMTAPKVKQHLMDAPEIILFFDADDAGRKFSGIDKFDENDKRRKSVPEIIRGAGYEGIIKVAELPPVSVTGYKDQDALIIAGKGEVVTDAIAAAREWTAPSEPSPPPKKIRTPFEKFNFLSVRRLQCLLKKLDINKLDKNDIAPFSAACLNAFPREETKELLGQWGAADRYLYPDPAVSPYVILTVIEKHVSRYMVREIERELTPVEEFIKQIKIQDVKFDLNFEEIEISQNARNFFYTGGIRSAALMLADIFDGKIIYNDAKNDKRFYFYDGHIWQHEPDMAGVIYNAMLSVVVHFVKQRKKNPAPDEEEAENDHKKFFTALKKIEDRRTRKDIEREFGSLKAEGVYHNSDDKADALHFDGEAVRETLTLQDCVFDMSGDKIIFRKSRPREYRRETLPYTLKQVRDTPVNYFWEFMRGNFKDEKTLETFMFYLSLIASRIQYKYGAFLIGGKNTGKSTTIKVIEGVYKYLIGAMDADVLVPKGKSFSSTSGLNPYIAQLEGLCASIISETEDGAVLNAGMWKKLTGGDRVAARGLQEAPKNFVNTAQIIIASNMIPRFNRHDAAIIERMIVIPFLVQHDRGSKDTKNPENIIEALAPEFPAVIRVLAEYYIKLKKEHKGVIPISRESNSYKMDVIAEVETDLDKFINVNIAFEKGQMERVKDVYEKYIAYYEFDENSARKGEALSRIRFTKFIIKNYKDFVFESTQRVRGMEPARAFIGLRIKTLDEIASAEDAARPPDAHLPTVAEITGGTSPDENPFG
jgi:phage/plasmid-associated DNA primase